MKATQTLSLSLIILLTVFLLSIVSVWYAIERDKLTSISKDQADNVFAQVETNIILSNPSYDSSVLNLTIKAENKGTTKLFACRNYDPESLLILKDISTTRTECIIEICNTTGEIIIQENSFNEFTIPVCNLTNLGEISAQIIFQPNNIHSVPVSFIA